MGEYFMKKRKIGILILIVIFIFILYYYKARVKSKVVVSTPITGKIIAIDAGHGKPDEGAIGYMNTTEQKINLQISKKLQNVIEQSGANAIITRSTEDGIFDEKSKTIRQKKVSDIKNRVKIINDNSSDIMLSIHLNKFPDERYKGWQVFYQKGNVKSEKLANKIQESLNLNINKVSNRTPKPIKQIYIMDNIEMPGVVIECGFISNKDESQILKDEEYQNKLSWGIYLGVQEYFREENNE